MMLIKILTNNFLSFDENYIIKTIYDDVKHENNINTILIKHLLRLRFLKLIQ